MIPLLCDGMDFHTVDVCLGQGHLLTMTRGDPHALYSRLEWRKPKRNACQAECVWLQGRCRGDATACAAIRTAGVGDNANKTEDQIHDGMKFMVAQLLHCQVHARVKRCLHRECHTPRDTKARTHLQHILCLNQESLVVQPSSTQTQSVLGD